MDSTGAPGVGVPDDDAQDDRALMGRVTAHAARGSARPVLSLGGRLTMPTGRRALIAPVQFTRFEAELLVDLASVRLATMTKVDREDCDIHVTIIAAIKKLEAVRKQK